MFSTVNAPQLSSLPKSTGAFVEPSSEANTSPTEKKIDFGFDRDAGNTPTRDTTQNSSVMSTSPNKGHEQNDDDNQHYPDQTFHNSEIDRGDEEGTIPDEIQKAAAQLEQALEETGTHTKRLLHEISVFWQESQAIQEVWTTVQQAEHEEAARLDQIEPDVQGMTRTGINMIGSTT
jgi:hypothetical protein